MPPDTAGSAGQDRITGSAATTTTYTRYAVQGPGGSMIERSDLASARGWATQAGPGWRVMQQVVTMTAWERVPDAD